ncbi:MAG: hypothetical protein JOY67_05065 [Hyphomicrobiales bacterium]|nr:hypothetical protein [Hyphomicrobiales bacterium]
MSMGRTNETEKRESRAYEKSRALRPEHSNSENVLGRAVKIEPDEELTANEGEAPGDEPGAEAKTEISMEEFITAERSLPDVPSETVDGLDELEEEIRRQAEDRPSDPSRKER